MGVDLTIFFPNNDIPKKETFTLLFVGRLSEVKGFDVLLDAFEILLKNNSSSIKCIVIADGDQQSHYKKSVKSRMLTDNVTFMGSQNQTRISEWMNQSHLVVIPSRKEGFGLVAIEALACGTPVICSDVGGLKEIVENGKNGFLFPVEQKDKLVKLDPVGLTITLDLENKSICLIILKSFKSTILKPSFFNISIMSPSLIRFLYSAFCLVR